MQTEQTKSAQQKPSVATLPSAASAALAAERMKRLSSVVLPELENIAKDPNLKPLFPSYFAESADGSVFLVPNQKPEDVLKAVKRIQELSPEIGERLQKGLKEISDKQIGPVKLPPGVQPARDEYLAGKNPNIVLQRLTVMENFLNNHAGPEQELYRKEYGRYVAQISELLKSGSDKNSDAVRLKAVQLLGQMGSPYADGAYKAISGIETTDEELLSAKDASLARLKPPPAEKAVEEAAKK